MLSPPSEARDERITRIRTAFIASCRTELRAMKPGNVHIFADGHRMTVNDFERSAEAASGPLCRPGLPVGERIRGAVSATWSKVGCNTNLGIILLAAPLITAAESDAPTTFRDRLAAVLYQLNVADAAGVYTAIALVRPAGLGQVDAQDVANPPTVTLKQAMGLAAHRDRIARQYITAYEDVFTIGVPRLKASLAGGLEIEWATTLAYLDFLSAFADSHIQRKYGANLAEGIRQEAHEIRCALCPPRPKRDHEILLAFDESLKARGINPGTSADLTVASLLVLELTKDPLPAR